MSSNVDSTTPVIIQFTPINKPTQPAQPLSEVERDSESDLESDSSAENLLRPYSDAAKPYKTIKDASEFTTALADPQALSDEALYYNAAIAQEALKAWQDEWITLNNELTRKDESYRQTWHGWVHPRTPVNPIDADHERERFWLNFHPSNTARVKKPISRKAVAKMNAKGKGPAPRLAPAMTGPAAKALNSLQIDMVDAREEEVSDLGQWLRKPRSPFDETATTKRKRGEDTEFEATAPAPKKRSTHVARPKARLRLNPPRSRPLRETPAPEDIAFTSIEAPQASPLTTATAAKPPSTPQRKETPAVEVITDTLPPHIVVASTSPPAITAASTPPVAIVAASALPPTIAAASTSPTPPQAILPIPLPPRALETPTSTAPAKAKPPPKPVNPTRSSAMKEVWAKRRAMGTNGRTGGAPTKKTVERYERAKRVRSVKVEEKEGEGEEGGEGGKDI